MRQRQTRYEKRVKRIEIVRDRQTNYAPSLMDLPLLLRLARRWWWRLRRLPGGWWNRRHGWRRRCTRSDFRREKLIQLIERIRRRRGPRACAWKLAIEVFHPAPEVIDDTFVVELVGDDARRDEEDELGTVILDILLAEEAAEDRYPIQQWKTAGGVALVGNDKPAHDHRATRRYGDHRLDGTRADRRRVTGHRGRSRCAHLRLNFKRHETTGIDVRRHLQ